MPDRFTLRAWAINTGNGNLLENRAGSSWCPVVMYRRPITAARALKRIRETHPTASVARILVTIEVLHDGSGERIRAADDLGVDPTEEASAA